MDKSDKKKRILTANQLDIDGWMDWMVNNVEIAKKEYPEMFELVREMVREKPPYFTAAIIEKIPEHFVKWNNDIDNCLLSTRERKLKTYIELIELLLYRLEFNSDIENNAVNKIKPELLEMEVYFKDLLTKPKKQQKKTTYQWQSNPDKEIPKLYSLMIDEYKLIAPETTYEQFTVIFTGQPIDTINPIKWHQDNASELLYFNEAIKSKVNSVWHIYKRMAACFVKPDGKPFLASFKELKQNLNINLSSDKQGTIDELVSNF